MVIVLILCLKSSLWSHYKPLKNISFVLFPQTHSILQCCNRSGFVLFAGLVDPVLSVCPLFSDHRGHSRCTDYHGGALASALCLPSCGAEWCVCMGGGGMGWDVGGVVVV